MLKNKHNLLNLAYGETSPRSYLEQYGAWIKLVDGVSHGLSPEMFSIIKERILDGSIPILASPNLSNETVETHCCGKVLEIKETRDCIYGFVVPYGAKAKIYKEMLCTTHCSFYAKLVGIWEKSGSIHRVKDKRGLESVNYIRLYQ